MRARDEPWFGPADVQRNPGANIVILNLIGSVDTMWALTELCLGNGFMFEQTVLGKPTFGNVAQAPCARPATNAHAQPNKWSSVIGQ